MADKIHTKEEFLKNAKIIREMIAMDTGGKPINEARIWKAVVECSLFFRRNPEPLRGYQQDGEALAVWLEEKAAAAE